VFAFCVRVDFSRTDTLDFHRAHFGLFRRMVDRVPWEAVGSLEGKRSPERMDILQEGNL